MALIEIFNCIYFNHNRFLFLKCKTSLCNVYVKEYHFLPSFIITTQSLIQNRSVDLLSPTTDFHIDSFTLSVFIV